METVGANGLPIDVVGQLSLSVHLCGTTVEQTFLIVEELTVEALLGADFLHKHKAVIDFAHHQLTGDTNYPPCRRGLAAVGTITGVYSGNRSKCRHPGGGGASVVIASGHLDGACITPSGLIEPQWYSVIPSISYLHVVSAQCRKVTSNFKSQTVKLFQGTRIGHFIPLEHGNVVEQPHQESSLSDCPQCNLQLPDHYGSPIIY